MTVEIESDVKLIAPKRQTAARPKKRMTQRRLCIMNTCAILVVIALLLLIVLKFVFGIHPDIFMWRNCLPHSRSFVAAGNSFLKDGKPFKYIAGSIHYSRVPNFYWRDRLRKMRYAGLDAVQVYVPWNFHQASPGQSVWTGDRDLVRFLQIAQEEDLLVILRAGPYICAEWDFGGLPAWLLQKNASMVIRSSDPNYMQWMMPWMTELLMKMRPLLYSNGGPIIMVQLENEYGSYPTCDKKYLSALYDLGRKTLGNDVILFSTDGNSAGFLRCGALEPRFLTTVDFGTGTANNPAAAFAALRKIRPTGPLVNSEYYVGWLDTWGSGHAHVPIPPILQGLKAMYMYNASVNMYMFFGGTNFAFWNGAEDPKYDPQVTSYDYDAPLNEAGDMTWKFQMLKRTICELKGNCRFPQTSAPPPTNSSALAYGRIAMAPLCHFVSLLPTYPTSATAGQPLASMESHGVFQGYAVYSAYIGPTTALKTLTLPSVSDAAYVFTSDKSYKNVAYHGVIRRDGPSKQVPIRPAGSNGVFLHVLVENGGHVNYGGHMQGDVKGIFGKVTLGAAVIQRWQFFGLDVTKHAAKLAGCDPSGRPSQGMFFAPSGRVEFLRGPNDTYMMPSSFMKGQFMMNNDGSGRMKNVGRYWPVKGPQKTLYVPRTFVQLGANSLVMFEVEGVTGSCPGDCHIDLVGKPQLSSSAPVFSPKRYCRGDRCPF